MFLLSLRLWCIFFCLFIGAAPGNVAESVILERESESTVMFVEGAKNAYAGHLTLKFSPDVTSTVPHHKHYCLEVGENCSPTIDHCIIRSTSVGMYFHKSFSVCFVFIRVESTIIVIDKVYITLEITNTKNIVLVLNVNFANHCSIIMSISDNFKPLVFLYYLYKVHNHLHTAGNEPLHNILSPKLKCWMAIHCSCVQISCRQSTTSFKMV